MAGREINKISLSLFWTILASCTAGALIFGIYFGKAKFDKEKNELSESNIRLAAQCDSLRLSLQGLAAQLDSMKHPLAGPEPYDIFADGALHQNLNLGVASFPKTTKWVASTNHQICMAYPDCLDWGSVFISFGKALMAPQKRASKDFSAFTRLRLELKGEAGSMVAVGLKNKRDPDDGSESKYEIRFKDDNWNAYDIGLDKFQTADLHRIYIVTEFVFTGKNHINVCARKIQFIR